MKLNRTQLSLLISAMLMALFMLLLYNLRLAAQQEDEYFMEVDLEAVQPEEEEKVPEEVITQNALNSKLKTHMAYNETAKSKFKEAEPFKTLEELEAEAKTQEAAEDNSADEGDKELLSSSSGYARIKDLIKKRKASEASYGDGAKKLIAQVNSNNKNTSVSYSLVDRSGLELPIPMYTCEVSGKIVVNITVNGTGDVTAATINAASSNSANACLTENAIAYALKARFNSSNKVSQIGTITYLFQGK